MGKCCGRCLKVLTFMISLAGIGYFAFQLYKKWALTPDISVEVKETPEHEIPFPAITICSPVFAKSQLANYNVYMTDIANHREVSLSSSEQNYLAANTHWCAPNVGGYVLENSKNRTETNVVKLLNESSLTSSELFVSCYLRNYMVECPKIFTRTLTDNGFCYTFNMKGYHTVFNENEISEEFDSYRSIRISETVELDEGYISYSARGGKINSATVYMQLNATDAANYCVPFGRIFKVQFHLPHEMPTPFHKAHYISFDHRRIITLSATAIKSDASLRNYPPDKRNCYFPEERKLRFFNSYTKAHCDFECFSNFTLNKCGCVKFSMPRSNDTSVCDLDNAHCYFYATNEWTEFDDEEDKKKTPCDCLPTCDDIKYNVHLNDADVVFDDINDIAGFKFFDKALRSRISFQFLDYIGEERLNIAGKDIKEFFDEYGVPLAIIVVCTFLPIINSIIDRCSGEEEEEGDGDGGGGGMDDVEKGIDPDQLQQDIKAEIGDVIGDDVVENIEQAKADYDMAKDLKEQASEKYNQGKDVMQKLKELNDDIGVGDVTKFANESLDQVKSIHSDEFLQTLQQINKDMKLVSNTMIEEEEEEEGMGEDDHNENKQMESY